MESVFSARHESFIVELVDTATWTYSSCITRKLFSNAKKFCDFRSLRHAIGKPWFQTLLTSWMPTALEKMRRAKFPTALLSAVETVPSLGLWFMCFLQVVSLFFWYLLKDFKGYLVMTPGMPQNLLDRAVQRLPSRFSPHPADVFCLVRHMLGDDDLCQPPLLVWPGNDGGQNQKFWREGSKNPGERFAMDEERANDLLSLARGLGAYPQFGRAIGYIEELCGKRVRVWTGVPPLPFFASGGRPRANLADGNLGPQPVRPAPHELRVRFRRGAGRRSWSCERKVQWLLVLVGMYSLFCDFWISQCQPLKDFHIRFWSLHTMCHSLIVQTSWPATRTRSYGRRSWLWALKRASSMPSVLWPTSTRRFLLRVPKSRRLDIFCFVVFFMGPNQLFYKIWILDVPLPEKRPNGFVGAPGILGHGSPLGLAKAQTSSQASWRCFYQTLPNVGRGVTWLYGPTKPVTILLSRVMVQLWLVFPKTRHIWSLKQVSNQNMVWTTCLQSMMGNLNTKQILIGFPEKPSLLAK